MAITYPTTLDSLTNPVSTDLTNSVTVPHATQHSDLNDAVEAIEAELGTLPKGASASVKARFDTLDTLVGTKSPSASPTFTGTVTLPTPVIHTVTTAITAATTQTQAAATALTTEYNAVYNVANNGDAVKLPTAAVGRRVVVASRDVGHTLQVFPATGDYIAAGAINASVNIAALKSAEFFCDALTKWQVSYSA